MNWSKTVNETGKRLTLALGRQVTERDIPEAVDELTTIKSHLAHELSIAHARIDAYERTTVDLEKKTTRLLNELEKERTRYRIPKLLQPLFRTRKKPAAARSER